MTHPSRFVLVAVLASLLAAPALAQPKKKAPQQPPPAAAAAPAAPAAPASAFPTIETQAQFAYIVDAQTGAVLLDKNAEQRMYPSSMTKMMTAYIILDKLQKGELKLEDQFAVSENAWRRGGAKSDSSTMYLELASRAGQPADLQAHPLERDPRSDGRRQRRSDHFLSRQP